VYLLAQNASVFSARSNGMFIVCNLRFCLTILCSVVVMGSPGSPVVWSDRKQLEIAGLKCILSTPDALSAAQCSCNSVAAQTEVLLL